MKKLVASFMHDDAGGEVIEYSLILGLIVVACIGVLGAFGTKVIARWNTANSSL
jgi:Flp pilus assembly pilin Flp